MARILLAVAMALCTLPATTHADVVTEWNQKVSTMIKTEGISNQHGNRILAMMHIAMFDAVNGIEGGYTPFLVQRRWPKTVPAELAASSAAYHVLAALYPKKSSELDVLFQDHTAAASRRRQQLAIRVGKTVAEEVLKWRLNDGSDVAGAGSEDYVNGTAPGEWRRTGDPGHPMLPGWGQVKPFAMTRNDQFRLQGPPDLDSYAYARDYNEVKAIGAGTSLIRTPEQTIIARFWAGGIPAIWNEIAHQLSASKQYGLLENARLFALLNVTMADANVMAWDMKYHYSFWRPVSAISDGDLDENDATQMDPEWVSLLPSPAFPEYVSGHSTACSSAATVLANFAGSDEFNFTVTSANSALSPRQFDSFWKAAAEAGMSRIYGGIHFNFSNVEGLEAGRSLGRYVYESFMVPVEKPGRYR